MNCPRCKSDLHEMDINKKSVWGITVFECKSCLSKSDLENPKFVVGYRIAYYEGKTYWESITIEGYRILYRYLHPKEANHDLDYAEGQTELETLPDHKLVGIFPHFNVPLGDTEGLKKAIKFVLAFS